MSWQTVSAAEWVAALLCSWAGISYSQGKRGVHLLSHLKSRVKTSVSKPGTSTPFGDHTKASTRTPFVPSMESDFFGKTGLLQLSSPGSEQTQRGTLPYFLAKLIALLLAKMPNQFLPFSQHLPGFHFWGEEVSAARHLYYYVKYCSRFWEPSALTFTQEYWTNAHSLTGWIFVRSYIKINVLIMAEEAAI